MTATLTVPATDLAAQWREIADDVEPKLLDLMRRGDYLGAAEVDGFEHEFAAYVGGGVHAVACSSGTDAVELMVRATTEPRDRVSVPSHTFVATLAAVERGGRDAYATAGPSGEAHIAVWLYGSTKGADAIARDCAERGIMLLEDASQAHGNPRAGRIGVAAAWSCYPSKNLGAAGQAGVVTFRDSLAAAKARRIREHGYDRATDAHYGRGFNMRMDGAQAIVLRAKLKRMDAWVERKREIARAYLTELERMAVYGFAPPDWEPDHSWHQFVITVPKRDGVLAALRAVGIGAAVHYRTTADGREDEWSRSCLSLPIHPHLTDEQVAYVIDAVLRAVRGAS